MTHDADDAIRLYLRWANDPHSLVDHDRLAALEAQAERAEDPLARLKAFAELERMRVVDEDAIRANFVTHARAWAQANDVGVEAFRRMNAKDSDLRAAGLLGGKVAAKAKVLKPTPPAEGRTRRPRTSQRAIVDHIPANGEFTTRDVAAASGASEATVRKVILGLVEDGTLVEAGTAKGAGVRGRAPLAYRRR